VAQKTVVELVDDLDGGEADETVAFALDGVEFTIDLSADNAHRLRDTLAEYVGHARQSDSSRARRGDPHRTNGTTNGRTDTQAIREWARNQGETVAQRGRISHDLFVRFQTAHGD
jgi:hypothetical protein